MNILMINYEYPPLGGGGGVINKHLAEALSKKNRITLITSKFADLKAHELCHGVEIFRVPVTLRQDKNAASLVSMLSFFPASLYKGFNLLKTRRFDFIHSMFAIPSAPSGYLLARAFRLPHVLSVLGGDVYDPSKTLSPHRTVLLHRLVKNLLTGSDKVIAMSSDIINRMTMHYDISRQIDCIPHAINRPLFTPKTRDALGYRPDEVLLVTIGRLIPRKAVHELIEVVQRLQHQAVKLLIIGDGPEKPGLQALAETLQVADRVVFLSNVDDERKFQLLNIADSYVSSTQHEGFGLVFLEAMSVGLPIVSYNNGGHVDFLIDGKTGYLVDVGDLDTLRQRVKGLCENAPLRQQMGQFNRQHVEHYYIENCAEQYQTLYESVVCGRP